MYMKKIYLLALVSCCQHALAQKETVAAIEIPYDRWSVELNVGQNKPIRPFSAGYYSSDPTNYYNFSDVNHFDLGVRYMFNQRFGIKLDGAYDQFENQSGSGSLPFSTELYRIGFQGVSNVADIMNFRSFTNRIGLLLHAGVQVSNFKVNEGLLKGIKEDNGGVMAGLTPQFRISNSLAFTADFTVISNVRQHLNWDGTTRSATDDNLSGIMYNTSIGLTYYIGKKQKHADWYYEDQAAADESDVLKRIAEIETLMNDTDKDGVPDYLDVQNNTAPGLRVDTKGRFIDLNNNGTPDELEPKRKDTDFIVGETAPNVTKDSFRELVANGLLNVFYAIDSDVPQENSATAIFQAINYMKQHPKAGLTLTGYADISGDERYNKDLSERRAGKLSAILIKNGIAPERITITGEGVDREFVSDKPSRSLARRVSITINNQ